MTRITPPTRGLAAAAALALLGVAGCSSESDSGASEPAKPAKSSAQAPKKKASSAAPKPAKDVTSLSVADTSAGKVVVDDKGMTVYIFDKDRKGAASSACKGPCLAKWPVVHGTADKVELKGVSGKVSSIKGPDGKPQLALNGMPLYYFVKDKAARETKGQGAMKVWWVVGANGMKIAR